MTSRACGCPVQGCTAPAAWPLPLCSRHWYRLPVAVRDQFWAQAGTAAAAASGPTDDALVSAEWLATVQALAAPAPSLPDRGLPCA